MGTYNILVFIERFLIGVIVIIAVGITGVILYHIYKCILNKYEETNQERLHITDSKIYEL